MHKTKEIRWFFRTENKTIKSWFDSLPFKTEESRTDFYLELNDENIGIKTRDGNIELKHRVGTKAKGCLSSNIWGCYENYIKWSFCIAKDDGQLSGILKEAEPKWTAVHKHRSLAQIVIENDKPVVKPISAKLATACQFEYTTLRIDNEVWNTCGLEWSGNEFLKLGDHRITEIFGTSKLNMKQSMGYPKFLTSRESFRPRKSFLPKAFLRN